MKKIVFVIFLVQFFWIANGCKKKEEEKPYEPVKQTYTDIPGTDAYIANTDTAFVDTGLVITVKGKGFDPAYKGHYTLLSSYYTPVGYSYSELPAEPKIVKINEGEIVFKYSPNYFTFDDCNIRVSTFYLVKFSDDRVAEQDYKKRFLSASNPKDMVYKNYYKVTKDTVLLQKPKTAYSDFFIEQYGFPSCGITLVIANKYFALDKKSNAKKIYPGDNYFNLGIPLDSNYNILDGYYPVKVLKDGKELFRDGVRSGVYVKNITK